MKYQEAQFVSGSKFDALRRKKKKNTTESGETIAIAKCDGEISVDETATDESVASNRKGRLSKISNEQIILVFDWKTRNPSLDSSKLGTILIFHVREDHEEPNSSFVVFDSTV